MCLKKIVVAFALDNAPKAPGMCSAKGPIPSCQGQPQIQAEAGAMCVCACVLVNVHARVHMCVMGAF